MFKSRIFVALSAALLLAIGGWSSDAFAQPSANYDLNIINLTGQPQPFTCNSNTGGEYSAVAPVGFSTLSIFVPPPQFLVSVTVCGGPNVTPGLCPTLNCSAVPYIAGKISQVCVCVSSMAPPPPNVTINLIIM